MSIVVLSFFCVCEILSYLSVILNVQPTTILLLSCARFEFVEIVPVAAC